MLQCGAQAEPKKSMSNADHSFFSVHGFKEEASLKVRTATKR